MTVDKQRAEEAEHGLPANLDAERVVLGMVLLDDTHYPDVLAALDASDFSIEPHRRIYNAFREVAGRNERIDRITVANDLMRSNMLDSVGGLSYLVSLDDRMPQFPNFDSYVRIVKDKAVLRRIVFSANHLMNRAMLQEETPEELLAAASGTFLDLSDYAKREPDAKTPIEVIAEAGGIEAILERGSGVGAIPTGFVQYDSLTGGLSPKDLVILGARPSAGKTSLALNIACHVAKQGHRVQIFSLEMDSLALTLRLLSAAAQTDSFGIRNGKLVAADKEKVRRAYQENLSWMSRIDIDDTAGISPWELHSRLRRQISSHGPIPLTIVDFLQQMSARGMGNLLGREQEISAISAALKDTAKMLNTTMLVLSQLSRKCDDRPGDHRPILSDLRESGAIEQAADIVAFLYRQYLYTMREEDLHEAELLVRKSRNGPTGDVKLVFLNKFTRFVNQVDDVPPGKES